MIIALEEKEFAQGQLCFRHLVTVLQIGSARSAYENQILLRYKHFSPAHDTWITKRSSLIERVTEELLKERVVFNPIYKKVREHIYPRAQRKRNAHK
jgi:hypothetical protein